MRLRTILPTALAFGVVLTGCANQSGSVLPGSANPAPRAQTLRTCGLLCNPRENLNVLMTGNQVGVYSQNPYDPTHSYQSVATLSVAAPPIYNPSNGAKVVLPPYANVLDVYASSSGLNQSPPVPSGTVTLAGPAIAFRKLVFDGASHLITLAIDTGVQNMFVVQTFSASGASGTEYPLGTIGLDPVAPAVGFPTDVTADPVTHTVYISDWLTQNIFVFAGGNGVLTDTSTPICEISPPAKGATAPKITHIAYNGGNHLLYVLLNTGEIEAFQGCSSDPVRDLPGLVSPSLAAYPWSLRTDLAADPISGTVAVAALTAADTVTVKSFGANDNGAVSANSFPVSGNSPAISYGP